VRLLGVSVTQLARTGDASQRELFPREDRSRRLRDALDRVRDKLGEASVVPLGTLIHRRRLAHVPFGALSARTLAPAQLASGLAVPRSPRPRARGGRAKMASVPPW
jgi:hypothetical protein